MRDAYVLDTNIISDRVRDPTGLVFQQIGEVGEATICTSIVVACELRYGVQKRGYVRPSIDTTITRDPLLEE